MLTTTRHTKTCRELYFFISDKIFLLYAIHHYYLIISFIIKNNI